MAKAAYAKRYAQAVFEIALKEEKLDKWRSDLGKIGGLSENAAIVAVLDNPKFHFAAKAKLLSELLSDISPLALNLAYLLVSKGRMAMVGDIAEEYQRFLNSHRGIEEAVVTTAVPLDDEDKVKLAGSLKDIIGKDVIIKPEVDPDIIGGVVANVGGKLIDGSTRSRLEALKRRISGVAK